MYQPLHLVRFVLIFAQFIEVVSKWTIPLEWQLWEISGREKGREEKRAMEEEKEEGEEEEEEVVEEEEEGGEEEEDAIVKF